MPPLLGPAIATTPPAFPPAPKRQQSRKQHALPARPSTVRPGGQVVDTAAAEPASSSSSIDCDICCSTDISSDNVTMCSSGHIFCKNCARKLAESQIGLRRSTIPCMAMEGCNSSFSEAEVHGFLPPATFRLWERIRAEEEIKAAGLDDIEHCPFCDFAAIIDNRDEKLFRCFNRECSRLSCRTCKREDHIPKSCLEHDIELREKSVHEAEEQLSAVLMRRCPQPSCNTPIVKEETVKSCNRMTCAVCKKDMCYCCRKDVSLEGYRHFDMESEGRTGRCPLWEDSMERHKRDLEETKLKMGAAAPIRTRAEEEDEAKRRRLFRERQNANFIDFDGIVDHPVEEVHLYNPPERDVHRWDVHKAVAAERRRRDEHIREAKNRQQEMDLVHRFEALAQREDRLQVLGFGVVAAVKPRRHETKTFSSSSQVGKPIPSTPRSPSKSPSKSQPRSQHKAQSQPTRPTPAPPLCPASPAKGKAKSSPPTSTPMSDEPASSSSTTQLPLSPNPNRSRKKHHGPLVQAANRVARRSA